MANNYFDSLLLSLSSMVDVHLSGPQKPLMVQVQVWISTVKQTKIMKNNLNLHPQVLTKLKSQLDGVACSSL